MVEAAVKGPGQRHHKLTGLLDAAEHGDADLSEAGGREHEGLVAQVGLAAASLARKQLVAKRLHPSSRAAGHRIPVLPRPHVVEVYCPELVVFCVPRKRSPPHPHVEGRRGHARELRHSSLQDRLELP
eukprot:768157-Hanusia_phi.AAC.3